MKSEDYTLFPIPTKLLGLLGIDADGALRVAVDEDGRLTVIKGETRTELEDLTVDDLPEENTDETVDENCGGCRYWCPHCRRCLLEDEEGWDGK